MSLQDAAQGPKSEMDREPIFAADRTLKMRFAGERERESRRDLPSAAGHGRLVRAAGFLE